MLACVYQVDGQSCGKYAWTEVQVLSFDDNDQPFWEKNPLVVELFVSALICLIIFLVTVKIVNCCDKGMNISSELM